MVARNIAIKIINELIFFYDGVVLFCRTNEADALEIAKSKKNLIRWQCDVE